MDRAGLIKELLSCARSVSGVVADLAAYGWDSDVPLAELKPSHIEHALDSYVQTRLSALEIEEWANAIECRDDIAYEPSSVEGEIIFELANPELSVQLSPARAEELLLLLSVRS
jgi:hypothetical protein